jgi:small subunit ribosomal protein S2
MKELLEAGVHFGHQTRRWDPKMKPYIFTERNGIHIIDLQKTIMLLKVAYNAIKELSKNNGTVLFVGTKRQAQTAIVEEATRCGMPYVANRWLGGMITNFATIKKSIMKLKRIERMEVDGTFDYMIKKEIIRLRREKDKLIKNIGGIKEMETLPDMVFIIDPKKEAIALAEAMKAGIPIVAIVDTNCNPEGIDYPIPGNDDAIRAINLFCSVISSSVIEGQNEAGKIEITEETKIMSLADEEKAEEEASVEEIEAGVDVDAGEFKPGEVPSGEIKRGLETVAVEGNEEDLEEELAGAQSPGVQASLKDERADTPPIVAGAPEKKIGAEEIASQVEASSKAQQKQESATPKEPEVRQEPEVPQEPDAIEVQEGGDHPLDGKPSSVEEPASETTEVQPEPGASEDTSTKLDAQSEEEEKETELKGE